jgi:hypothetical protein
MWRLRAHPPTWAAPPPPASPPPSYATRGSNPHALNLPPTEHPSPLSSSQLDRDPGPPASTAPPPLPPATAPPRRRLSPPRRPPSAAPSSSPPPPRPLPDASPSRCHPPRLLLHEDAASPSSPRPRRRAAPSCSHHRRLDPPPLAVSCAARFPSPPWNSSPWVAPSRHWRGLSSRSRAAVL